VINEDFITGLKGANGLVLNGDTLLVSSLFGLPGWQIRHLYGRAD
jgi:hypothetical protein